MSSGVIITYFEIVICVILIKPSFSHCGAPQQVSKWVCMTVNWPKLANKEPNRTEHVIIVPFVV